LKFNSALFFVGIYITVLLFHLGVLSALEIPLWDNKLLLSYGSNFSLTAFILWTLFKVFERNTEQVGILFIGSSLIKFMLFFLVFYPAFKADGNIQKSEVITFFIPYFTGLFLETGILVIKLNKI
tara:strand:- start:623 stop:997 length:375 start_codon:yes stop_codon:yes gene_type:complete